MARGWSRGARNGRARWAGVKCGRYRPLGKGNCLCPAAAPSGQDGTEPTHHTWAWLPGLRREPGSYPVSEGLHMAGPPDAQLGTQRQPRGHLRWVRGRLWRGHSALPHSGLTGACSAPKGSLRAWGSQMVHLGRGPSGEGPRGVALQPLPLGVCRHLLSVAHGITPGWSPGAQQQVLQAARAQVSYQNSACSWRQTQG